MGKASRMWNAKRASRCARPNAKGLRAFSLAVFLIAMFTPLLLAAFSKDQTKFQIVQRLVAEQLLPPSLMSTVVLPSYFRRGVMELQIPVATNALWEQAWLQAKSA